MDRNMAGTEAILKELKSFHKEKNEHLETIRHDISKINIRLEEAEERTEKNEERIQNTEEVMAELVKLQTKLEDKLMDVESRSRRDNVRIYGVP